MLRRNQTEAEKILWSRLRNKSFFGLKFYRQYGIGLFIADFYCPKHRVEIEVDGGQHYEENGVSMDDNRNKYFARMNIEVLRFNNAEVIKNIDEVLVEIRNKITPPIPSLTKEGLFENNKIRNKGYFMKNKIKMYVLGFLVLILTACAAPYQPAPQILPQNVRKIYIKPFVNDTNQFGIEEKLNIAIANALLNDGRFIVVNNEKDADGMLVGEIAKYNLIPLAYDANLVTTQYKLWILVNIYFVDKSKNVTLWAEPNMEGIQVYNDATLPGGMTEEEARQAIWANMSNDIVNRTVNGFGSISGISDKKVPQ